MGAKEGGGDTPSSSSSLLLVNLPLLYDDDKVAKLVSDTPAGRARPAPRAYRAKKGHQGHGSLGGLQSTH